MLEKNEQEEVKKQKKRYVFYEANFIKVVTKYLNAKQNKPKQTAISYISHL